MLQQTQAARVAPVFERFVARWPTPDSLAAATRADVVRAWAGLGYNRRAINLHEAARIIARHHSGEVPRELRALQHLPGIGPYTAAAVASLAFGAPVAALDTNVRRIVARAVRASEPDEVPTATLRDDADAWLDRRDPAGWNSALMDLGRTVCRPTPRCEECPLSAACAFHRAGRVGRRSSRRQSSFEGSSRQLRGRIVDALRERASIRRADLEVLDASSERIDDAVRSLERDGLLERARGRLRLPDVS